MDDSDRKRRLAMALDDIGWGLLLLAFGALAMPTSSLEYFAVAAIGAGFLGLNLVRLAVGVPISWFSIVLGATGLVAGSVALAGSHVDAFVVFFAFAGAATVMASAFRFVRPVSVA